MAKETVVLNFSAIANNNSRIYDVKTMSSFLKIFFSNLAEYLLVKLPVPTNKFNLESVFFN